MPVAAPVMLQLSPEDYFAWDEQQQVKHEHVHSGVFPLPGATREHTLIAGNFFFALRLVLLDTCTVFDEGMRVQVEGGARYAYPDLSVVCGEETYVDAKRTTLANPTLLVEVLSESTEAYGRGEKLETYRQIASLRQIVLVAQDRQRAEVYTRDGEAWSLREVSEGGALELASVGVQVALADLYRGV